MDRTCHRLNEQRRKDRSLPAENTLLSQSGYFEYAGAAGVDRLSWLPFSRGRVFDICEKDDGQYDNIAEVFWATGAAMFVKAAVFHEMGGLDGYFLRIWKKLIFAGAWNGRL